MTELNEAQFNFLTLDERKQLELLLNYNQLEDVLETRNAIRKLIIEVIGLQTREAVRDVLYIKCDVCGCSPNVIIKTEFGTFCNKHARYI